jgi:protein SCO1/2
MQKRAPFYAIVILILSLVVIWSAPFLRAAKPTEGGSGKAAIGGHFSLTDQHGKTVTDTQFRGKPMLVFFGFTHCPDICPLTVGNFSALLESMGKDGAALAAIFISVDPRRDTPEVLKSYFANFDSRIIALTGSYEQIDQAASAYKAYYDASPDEKAMQHGGEYMVNHSGYIYLMDKNGEYVRHFNYDASPADLAKAVGEML